MTQIIVFRRGSPSHAGVRRNLQSKGRIDIIEDASQEFPIK